MAQREVDLRARLRDIERHLQEMPPHNASGSRDDLERQRVDLQRRLAAPASTAAPRPAVDPAPADARAGALRSPVASTPTLVAGAFRRTTHIACGPSDGQDYGDGVEVARDLHGAARDVLGTDDGPQVLDEAHLHGHLDDERHITALTVSTGEVPAGLVGAQAVPGLRRIIADALDETTSARAAALLDVGVGGNLAAYGRMQAGRLSGKSAGQVLRPGALAFLGDSCRGWALDGAAAAALQTGTHRPAQLPPAVPSTSPGDHEVDGWHDLGAQPAWWIRRQRRIDVLDATLARPEDDRTTVVVDAGFRDSWVDPDDVRRSLHEWELVLELDATGVILRAVATARSLPFAACPSAGDEIPRLVGTTIDDLRRSTRELLAGTLGCTHLNDLLTTIPAAVTAATTDRRA